MSSPIPFDQRDTRHLITGGTDPFLPVLIEEINHASKIDIAVAFIKDSGFQLIKPALEDAIASNATVRILTSDYLQVTDPVVLREMMILSEQGAQCFVFETDLDQSFHLKAYMFIQSSDGTAYIGSSNISKTALQHGLEWNLRVKRSENPVRFTEIMHQFERLLAHHNVRQLSHEWIDSYQEDYRRKPIIPEKQSVPDEFDPADVPEPYPVQIEALNALTKTRDAGNTRGLVVLATGMGKTWLAAFDSRDMHANRILFVAHREEILQQAEQTFARIRPDLKTGKYNGDIQDENVDMLFASVMTLGKLSHLAKFDPQHFDYIVIDEFHHAAARTYRKLLNHFEPRFLLGLTATPKRSDQADILSLCDNNLVFTRNLFEGIEMDILCPFHYWGIADQEVDYTAIPWRNGKFDPEELLHQLATHNRAEHVLSHWKEKRQTRTLAFCSSTRHADFMAKFFTSKGIRAVSVHSESEIRRNQALNDLKDRRIDIIFSVDLFNEGVDLPTIDTILMLRPTESQIIFLQQLGRGLRKALDKSHSVIVDFIGNHISFFRKAEGLFNLSSTGHARQKFLDQVENNQLELPPGCFINYDPQAIDFMKQFIPMGTDDPTIDYTNLYESLGRRPSLDEFYLQGGSVSKVRNQLGQWHRLPEQENHLTDSEIETIHAHAPFLKKIETGKMTESYKMVLLEAFIELDGFSKPVALDALAEKSFFIIKRRPQFHQDLQDEFRTSMDNYQDIKQQWERHWQANPVNAWIGGNNQDKPAYFHIQDDCLHYSATVLPEYLDSIESLSMEILEYRYSQYNTRLLNTSSTHSNAKAPRLLEVPYFSDLEIACGYFLHSEHRTENIQREQISLKLVENDTGNYFIARATGNSMNNGRTPIYDGDQILLRHIKGDESEIDTGIIVALEQKSDDKDRYLLKQWIKDPDGTIQLHSSNPEYPPFTYEPNMRVFAKFIQVLKPLDLMLHKSVKREDIPPLFGLEFNSGLWNSGHVCPKEIDDQILLVTLNKRKRSIRYPRRPVSCANLVPAHIICRFLPGHTRNPCPHHHWNHKHI
jgi:superfamily II DNA or RNA helicase/SOS-response transcriptional repressor LexA